MKHISSIVYYPQGNGQTESIDKVFGTLLMNLVKKNWNDWDEHLSTLLFFYRTILKVGTSHTPFQCIYELHLLLHVTIRVKAKPMIQNLLEL